MSGDWIKMRVDLHDDPAVVSISVQLGLEESHVVGLLHRAWGWADKHTTDGVARGISVEWLDKYVGHPGFSAAMMDVKWLNVADRGRMEREAPGLEFLKFEKHNGESAKKRARNTARVQLSRRAKGATRARLEKSRKEKTTTNNTPRISATFADEL